MKQFFLSTLATLCLCSNLSAAGTDPEVVPNVDLVKYSGAWLQIANSPNFFQKNCIRSKAEYAPIDNRSLTVKNTCTKADGKITTIEGVAKIVDEKTPAKLKVRFNFFARGDYWITELDENYKWAVVSGPAKKSIFILARQAPMEPELLKSILKTLSSKGYKIDDLKFDIY